MKKLYFILIGFIVFGGVEAQIINFPDANFKAKLLCANYGVSTDSTQTPYYDTSTANWTVSSYNKIDMKNDGEIQLSEALLIKYLNDSNFAILNTNQVTDLSWMEYFTQLQYLNCASNDLSSLNISNFTNLTCLNYSNNHFPSLILTSFLELTYLDSSNNNITNLDVSGLMRIKG